MTRWTASLLLGVLFTGFSAAAPAADLSRIPRTIGKEPAYQTKGQRYCLLVFGPSGEYRVWLVLDGDRLYADRNGNGDLTETGEFTEPEYPDQDPCGFKSITILRPGGKTGEELRFSIFGWRDYGEGKKSSEFSPALSISWNGRRYGSWGDETGPCIWGRTPQDAPILHVGGPLRMGFEIRAESALKRKRDNHFELSVGVGTPGLGKGSFVHLQYFGGAIPERVYPTADLEFPAKSGGEPIRMRAVLKQRC